MSIIGIIIGAIVYIFGAGLTKSIYNDCNASWLNDRRTSIIGFLWPITLPWIVLVFVLAVGALFCDFLKYCIGYCLNPFLPEKWRL